jgi:glutaredoxin
MSSFRLAALAAFVACAAGWGALAHAQVYRIVGPDGRVTFSDRPPAAGQAAAAPSMAIPGNGTGTASLPLEVRTAAGRYPFTLYTGRECGPCDLARSFLNRRGIPFTEKTVTSAEDIAALQQLSGAPRLPFATLGGQHLAGFSESEWNSYLDAAGYPKVSRLPASYRNPQPTPMVAVHIPAAPAAAAQPQAEADSAPASSLPAPSNPAGIRF